MLRSRKIVKLNFLMKIVTVLFIFCFSNSWGQSIWTNPITATDPSTANPYTNGQTVIAGITVSGIGRGSGLVASTALNRYSATGWNSGSLDPNDYFEFTLTPNAGCEINFTSFEYTGQASGTASTTILSFRSSVDAFATSISSPPLTGGTISLAGASYQNVTVPITFRLYGWGASASGGSFSINDFTFNGSVFCSSCVEPTAAASSPVETQIGCNGFNLSWANGGGTNRLVVVSTSPITSNPVDGATYTANSSYGSGSTIGANQYVIYNGTGNTDYILGLAANTLYYYKIFEFNYCAGSPNYLTSGTVPGGDVTTTTCSSPAGITAVYIDACAGGCGFEGNNELIWGTTGSYAMNVSANGPTLHYNSTPTPTLTFISTYSINTSNITTLNNADGACGSSTFFDPNTLGYIPPNSTFLIANNCMCSPSAYDFSGLCGSGPIYVVFGTNASWPCNSGGGIFGNYSSGGGVRYFDLDFNAWGVSLDPIYNYTVGSLSNGGDGDIVLINPAGGAATTYSNSACVVPLVVLPIELLDFYATQNGDKNDLVWKVASENNILQYIIEKSEDGINFSELTRVNAINIEGVYQLYSCEDFSPYDEITYYRLSTLENSGKTYLHKIIDVDRNNKDWKSTLYQNDEELILEFKNSIPKNAQLLLFDLSGKLLSEILIEQSSTRVNTTKIVDGIYFAKIETPYKTENFKIIIRNDR